MMWCADMARVELILSDEDLDRFSRQARREGMSLSAWFRAAAWDRLSEKEESERFKSVEDLNRFFAECDARRGPGRELDWEEHKRLIEESRLRGCVRMNVGEIVKFDKVLSL